MARMEQALDARNRTAAGLLEKSGNDAGGVLQMTLYIHRFSFDGGQTFGAFFACNSEQRWNDDREVLYLFERELRSMSPTYYQTLQEATEAVTAAGHIAVDKTPSPVGGSDD